MNNYLFSDDEAEEDIFRMLYPNAETEEDVEEILEKLTANRW